jgi:hypothetical protein
MLLTCLVSPASLFKVSVNDDRGAFGKISLYVFGSFAERYDVNEACFSLLRGSNVPLKCNGIHQHRFAALTVFKFAISYQIAVYYGSSETHDAFTNLLDGSRREITSPIFSKK